MIADSVSRGAGSARRNGTGVDDAIHPPQDLAISLLGGFRVEQAGDPVNDDAWGQRRHAKTLIKLLAAERTHSLHRDQILEILWPEAGPDSALNGFSKALHAARRALEPDLLPRAVSKYLRLNGDILSLDQDVVWIDIDHFESLAEQAMRVRDVHSYQAACAAYTGELLPEDRYEDWAEERRIALRDTHARLLVALADVLAAEHLYDSAAENLRRVIQEDPAREDVHRRLMRLYAEAGHRHDALRQYQLCRQALERELDVEPDAETDALYEDIVENRIQKRELSTPRPDAGAGTEQDIWSFPNPLVGRDRALEHLRRDLARAESGKGRLVLIGGESGVGKRRLVAELAREAQDRGVPILWGTGASGSHDIPYGPFIAALEWHLATRTPAECLALAQTYPELAGLIPSLAAVVTSAPPTPPDADSTQLTYPILRLLTDIANDRPVLLILGDLHAADAASLQLLEYLARLSGQQKWLLIGMYREEDMERGGAFHRMLAGAQRKAYCLHIELRRLARQDSDRLVEGLLPDGAPNDDLLEQVYSLTLGNPLFVEEMISTMKDLGQLLLKDGRWSIGDTRPGRVPRRIRDLVELRLAHLDTDVSRVLAMAATAETPFSFDTLRAGAAALYPPVPDTVLLEALDRAVSTRILVERDDGYEFRHPLFQQALAEGLSGARRAQLRSALSGMSERAGQRRAGDLVDRRSSRGRRATDRLEDGGSDSRDETARQYGELLDRLEVDGRMLEAADVRRKLADALIAIGRYNRAAQVLSGAIPAYEQAGDLDKKRALEAQIALLGIMRSHTGPSA